MAGFEDLEVWQRAVALSAAVYRETAKCKDFGFRGQARAGSWSAFAIANMPWGHARGLLCRPAC